MALPWSTIDMDFMNLNQAAHGDREFGYIQTRLGVARKTVVGHVEPTRRSPRGSPPGRGRPRGLAATRTLRLARFGDNMRDVAVTEGDKVEAQLRFGVSVNTYGVNDLVAVVDAVRRRRHRRARHRVRRHLRRRRPSCCPAATGTSRCATAPASSSACAPSSTDGGFSAFTTNFEDLGGLRQLPGLAVQRLMADGYGFGGEGDWKTSVLLRALKVDGRRACRAARPSWRTTPTTWRPARSRSSARTCWRSARPSPRSTPALRDPPAVHRRPRGPGPAGVHRRPRPGRRRRHRPTWATGSG